MPAIGFIGLGAIGSRMAKNILKSGYALTVFDINPDAVNEQVQGGAAAAPVAREVGERSDIVFLMVQNYAQCESCLLGADGLLAGMKPGGIVIISSTVSPDQIRKLAQLCADKGVEVLDTPVSGGVKGAGDGTLTLMCGGREAVYQACLPVLQAVGSKIVKVGDEAGLGQAMKAVNQHLVSIHLASMAEAMVMGVKSGLDPEMIYDIIVKSAGNSWMLEDKMPFVLNRDFSPRSSLAIQHKDLKICMEIGESVGAPMLLGKVCEEIYGMAANRDLSGEDSSSVIKVYEEMADVLVQVNKKQVSAG
jgi:2-hydroxymethylglutarate dehydrogenase